MAITPGMANSSNTLTKRQKPTRLPYSCQAQFGTSGIGEPPAGGVSTVRGIGLGRVPFLDIDDHPHRHAGAVRQLQRRTLGDRRIGDAVGRQHRPLRRQLACLMRGVAPGLAAGFLVVRSLPAFSVDLAAPGVQSNIARAAASRAGRLRVSDGPEHGEDHGAKAQWREGRPRPSGRSHSAPLMVGTMIAQV